MRAAIPLTSTLIGLMAISPVAAAGNGAGAGGAGHQRAINSGLPPGQAGPAGAMNNPHGTAGHKPGTSLQVETDRHGDQ